MVLDITPKPNKKLTRIQRIIREMDNDMKEMMGDVKEIKKLLNNNNNKLHAKK